MQENLTDEELRIVEAAHSIGIEAIEIVPYCRYIMSQDGFGVIAPRVEEGVLRVFNTEYVFLQGTSPRGILLACTKQGKQKWFYITTDGQGQPRVRKVKRKHRTIEQAEAFLRKKRRI